ncbi:hypothetical protein MSAN_00580800 [Mycena sanguinolenta]|uniref:Uncharacterized protein n=1 Tax=Mycena sanguinolenta TaxID=230812 RepID=A0A8H6Z6Z2_9AGAR|nr:hypothetical protein MSAN_00580800 [Mycena sanguinolenta]
MLVEIGCRLGLPDEIVVSAHDHTASLARDAFGFKQRKAQNTLVDIVVFRIDPLTGASVDPAEANTERLLQGTVVLAGALIEAFILPESDVVILVDEFFQINPYPNIEASTALLAHHAPNLRRALISSLQKISLWLPRIRGAQSRTLTRSPKRDIS